MQKLLRLTGCTALIGSALLAGCATPYSEAPLVTNFPTTKQEKLQAAQHWNVIAGDVARQIGAALKDKPPLYVNMASNSTPFDRAFSAQLLTSLMTDGFQIRKSALGALSVEVDTQTISFSANRPKYNYVGVPTILTTGIVALHTVEATAGFAAFTGIALTDTYFWASSEFATGKVPQNEIIVTVSVSDANQYHARSTHVYYVPATDSQIYEKQVPPQLTQTKAMGVVGR